MLIVRDPSMVRRFAREQVWPHRNRHSLLLSELHQFVESMNLCPHRLRSHGIIGIRPQLSEHSHTREIIAVECLAHDRQQPAQARQIRSGDPEQPVHPRAVGNRSAGTAHIQSRARDRYRPVAQPSALAGTAQPPQHRSRQM
ncbi:hypothetical protein AB0H83_34335 [Dactylosporangium sp. NPDC050688]|uniref:hypothetical protein n=1 Tax=Dactylosporangium sp. NPDC050688 TaxID=3157217 RepID=UPI00340848BA